ncbi:MAG: nucleotidyltransferase domain-containing protein [Rhizomicrobium sp.]
MTISLETILEILRANEAVLRPRGVRHAAIFGSMARGDARGDSDVDILVELEDGKPSGIFEYVRLRLDVGALLGRRVDLVEDKALKRMRGEVLRDKVDAF